MNFVGLLIALRPALENSSFDLTGPEGASKDVNVVTVTEDSYTIDYIPEVPGNYVLNVNFAGNRLEDSPKFTVADSGSVKVYGPAFDGVKVGEKAVFHVDVSDAGEGKLALLMKGPEQGEISCDGPDGPKTTFSLFLQYPENSYLLSSLQNRKFLIARTRSQ